MGMNLFRFKAKEQHRARLTAFLDEEWLAGRVDRWLTRESTDSFDRIYAVFGESGDLRVTEAKLAELAEELKAEER